MSICKREILLVALVGSIVATVGVALARNPGPDYSLQGPYAVQESRGYFRNEDGRQLPYIRYRARGAPQTVLIVLAHGFSRSQSNMRAVARHYASWGLDVVTLDLAYSRPWNTDHTRNGRDMAALARTLTDRQVIYAGHSAGGLAAIVAAGRDGRARAVLGLDLVDSGSTAARLAAQMNIPIFGILGESQACNSSGNGLAVYQAAPTGRAIRVREAGHCHFESPTDWLCTAFCGSPLRTYTEAEVRRRILGLATGFLLWQAGLRPDGKGWWMAGMNPFDAMISAGSIAELR
ncbi:MAG: hypothetical protein KatS3mg024_0283 [Armatimonadota bacterium]|nr:MAG: hypothetical protein KatS3mg024_0283 [Armatimonadota bacterium]